MIRGAIAELRRTPIGSLGALAGVISLFITLAGSGGAAPHAAHVASAPSTEAAMAILKLWIVVPGTAFSFAHIGTILFPHGAIRAGFITLLLFLMSLCLSAAVAGVLLSSFHVSTIVERVENALQTQTNTTTNQFVIGINLGTISFGVFIANVLMFGGVVGEGAYQHYFGKRLVEEAEPQTADEDDEEETAYDDQFAFLNIMILGLLSLIPIGIFVAFFWNIAHVVFKATLGIF